MGVGAAVLLYVSASCNWVFSYPDSLDEASSALCTDETDNDFDGRIDCDDPSCDGFCPEQGTESCADGRDNDSDGLTDGADPRCWPSSSLAVTRCASWDPIEFEERFDSDLSFGRWLRFGSLSDGTTAVVERQSPKNRYDRPDGVLGFSPRGPGEGVLGGIVSVSIFDGDWRAFEVTVQARLEAGGLARVGWVPASLAPLGESPSMNAAASAVLVELDAREAPRIALLVHQQRFAADWLSSESWHAIRLAASEGELRLEVDGTEVARAPLPSIPPSRLVVWGEAKPQLGLQSAAQLDDVQLRLPGIQPCGVVAPQIPLGRACRHEPGKRAQDVGFTVSAVQGAGMVCALVTSGPAGAGKATATQSWTSPDGFDWTPGGQLPEVGDRTGASVAFDPATKSFGAVVAEATSGGIRLRRTMSSDCMAWGDLWEVGVLPSSSEAPSYLLPGVVASHEIYFTRPRSSQSKVRTLWRVGSDDGTVFEAAPELVAELPESAYAEGPFAMSRAGQRDIVGVYRLSPDAPVQGLGLLVAMDDTLSQWQPAGVWPLLSAESARGAFDSDELVSGTVIWSGDQGVALYAARGWPLALQNEGGGTVPLTVGTARLSLAGNVSSQPTRTPEPVECGNGTCDPGESCSSGCRSGNDFDHLA